MSTDVEFTPGPWQAIPTPSGGWDGFQIRTLGAHIATSKGPTKDKQCQADARLIAAAPDLYEALKAIMNHYGPGTLASDEMYDAACAALAKAEGKSHGRA